MNLTTLTRDERRAQVAKRLPKLLLELPDGRFIWIDEIPEREVTEREWLEVMRLAEETLPSDQYKRYAVKVGISSDASERLDAFCRAVGQEEP